ncbi:hypothetical protein [Sphingomonas colocasiae]|uniref:Uncharacterized protein n=1 Tax=Sphingomonas colocasiae TaxID=1848973 RepID=A0ABS7PKU7_9SPHN|nr:hypothetical protein [Sphingomonas colocasiae]MBY8821933.1 hypothetical protein [Sphingomonas colocasiae]
MLSLQFYQEQAALQQIAADNATLENVRERCQRAADTWAAFAARSERAEKARIEAASEKLLAGLSENPDQGCATV